MIRMFSVVRGAIVCTSLIIGILVFATDVWAGQRMTINDVRSRALDHNRTYLSALEDEVQAETEISVTRADALPELRFDGSYSRNFLIPTMFIKPDDGPTLSYEVGFKNNFRGTLSLRQSLWHGNKVYTAYDVAKLYRKYSSAISDQVRADIIYQADLLFYNISRRRSDLDVIKSEHEALSHNYDVVEKRHSQGMASEFDLLQAAVQRDNLLPGIVSSESELVLAQKRLKSWLGFDLEEDITFIETDKDSSMTSPPSLEQLAQIAIERRPEVMQASYLVDISSKAIKIARGEYFPKLEAVAAYDWSSQSDEFTLSSNISKSWTAGLQVSFPLFEGLRTRADVSKRKAQHKQARLSHNQVIDNIKLEVEQAYDRLLQAEKSLDIQGGTIARAEEGLRIANLRYESGVGAQLEVLSAQAALSVARGALSEALYLFRQARAGLKKATTVDYEVENKL